MFIPLRCDAPLYHRPWATIGVIALNIIVHLALLGADDDTIAAGALFYDRFHPWTWITSVFLHADFIHLIGNMLFLWIFGLIVEGKIGWRRFLALYLGIAVGAGAFEQLIMIGAEGGSLGASGVIFGLMAIALVWAPENEIDTVLIFLIYPLHVSMRVVTFAGLSLAWELGLAVLGGFSMGSALLHLIGAGIGLPIGVLMLKRGWVDCEGWDWFSRRRPRAATPAPRAATTRIAAPAPAPPAPAAEHVATITELVIAELWDAAWRAWIANGAERLALPVDIADRLVWGLFDADRIDAARRLLTATSRYEAGHAGLRLGRARLAVLERRPQAALEELGRLGDPPAARVAWVARLTAEARQLQAAGVVEFA